ncbi:MAG: hypothetical protein HY057_01985 [Rhodospirillales bacterium]|nr:hypothetical protein [Rhodospirillales bacterium]
MSMLRLVFTGLTLSVFLAGSSVANAGAPAIVAGFAPAVHVQQKADDAEKAKKQKVQVKEKKEKEMKQKAEKPEKADKAKKSNEHSNKGGAMRGQDRADQVHGMQEKGRGPAQRTQRPGQPQGQGATQ